MDVARGQSMRVAGPALGGAGAAWTGRAEMAARQRLQIGDIAAELLVMADGGRSRVSVTRSNIALVFAERGRGDMMDRDAGDHLSGTINGCVVAVLARPGRSEIHWSRQSRVLILHMPRQRLQMLASRRLGDPVRVAVTDFLLTIPPRNPLLARLAALTADVGSNPRNRREGAEPLYDQLAASMVDHPQRGSMLLVSRSVKRAIEHIRADAESDHDAESLAAIAGVTPRTLRDGFRACLGMPLASFVREARLNRTRERLAGGRDTRPLAQVAAAAGFAQISSFTRAYLRTFGETPTRTRQRAAEVEH